MNILAIDPGATQSATVLYTQISSTGKLTGQIQDNTTVLHKLRNPPALGITLVIEGIASYGMPVGREVFETCYWVGRFIEAWDDGGCDSCIVLRRTVKLHLCNSVRATDANIRQVMLDRYGKPGTKKAPGMTYGFKGDMWSALAVATTFADLGTSCTEALLSERASHV